MKEDNILRTLNLAILIVASAATQTPAVAAQWSPINSGLSAMGVSVNSLVIDSASPSTVYALTTVYSTGSGAAAAIVPGLLKSTDNGDNWIAVGTVAGATCLAIDPSNPSNLYAGTSQGVMKSADGGQSWIDHSQGLPVGSVTRLLVDPSAPSTLYALLTNTPPATGTSLFKTTDAGGSWNELNTGFSPGAYVTTMLLAPSDPATIYLLAPAFNPMNAGGPPVGGLRKSDDGGQTWTAVNSPLLTTVLVSSLAVDANVPNTLYLVDNQGLQKSTDGGQTWSVLDLGLATNSHAGLVVTGSANPKAVYVTATTFSPIGTMPSLLESTDGGITWIPLNVGLPTGSGITSVALHPRDPSRIYTGVSGVEFAPAGVPPGSPQPGSAVFKTLDGGQTWNFSNAGLATFDVRALAINPGDENIVYAGGYGGVFRSADGGATWNPTGLAAYTSLLVADPVSPGSLYALTGTSNGCNSLDELLLASADDGANWSGAVSPANSGCILNSIFYAANAPRMAIATTNTNTLYLAESDNLDGFSAILESTDRAADWTIAWDWFNGLRAPVRALAVDPSQSATVYAGMDDGIAAGGLFKSGDGGATWTNTGLTASAVSLLAIDPANPQNVYAATEGHNTSPAGFQGLFKSTDGGQTWLAISTGLAALLEARSTTATALAIDPTDPQVLYLGTSTLGVYRTTDGGATWSPFNDGLTSFPIRCLAVANGPSHFVYAVTSGGVFKYADVLPARSMLFGAGG